MAILIAINLAVVGASLPLVMGSPVSRGAQHAQRYFIAQACGWVLILAASQVRDSIWDPILSISATCSVAFAQWKMAQALQCWLGPRPLRRLLIALCILGPVGFALLFESITARLAWFSLCHGLCIGCLTLMCLHPSNACARSWRFMLMTCGLTMMVSLYARAYMALFTPWLLDFTADTSVNYVFAAIAHVCGSIALVCMLVAWRDETNHKMRDLAMTDHLTDLPNRRALMHAAPLMQAMAKRQKLPFAVVLIDLDYFKLVNDRYGHTMGDHALQLFGRVLKEQVRMEEIAARWGGEEFCILMYAEPRSVDKFYHRLSQALHTASEAELGFALGISAGCAVQDRPENLQQLLQRADAALYEAKAQGRARLVFESTAAVPLAPAQPAPQEAVS